MPGREPINGNQLLLVLNALANPHRLRIVAALAEGTNYVSQLARDLQISRPLLHMHLQRLEAAGIVEGHMEVSDDGKALRYYVVTDFAFSIDAAAIAEAARTLTQSEPTGRTKGK